MNTKINFGRYLKKGLPLLAALVSLLLLMAIGPAYKLGLFFLYALAGLYVHARLKKLLPSRRRSVPSERPVFLSDSSLAQRVFSLVFLLLALAYPLIELLAHGDPAGSLKYVLLFGYYSLPFLFYVSLLTAAGDLLLLLNRFLKIVPQPVIHSRKIALGALGFLLAASLGIVMLWRIH